ncbi:MAG: 6-phosphogluconolactonase [Gomphosphaeria aponina SAG 52.96 = DSM 107014]|uniref:6-phosphogluconolactonase n=1 Tax=Gomphosphaeria aponina SAG 52.96 = DSM 107014 TaxID=1521640 RepID=A0A941GRT4_9CHRO|nr:6-phosphogluconolactonase [Gomphosphaeria aponina SAG 52.96 = DSM 107014]
MQKFIEVLPDLQELVNRSLLIVREKIQAAIVERGLCTLALAGGSTPVPLYRALSSESFPWEKIHVFWGDERYVPPDHPDSNQKMAREVWLNQVKIPASNIHPMPTASVNPTVDAEKYSSELSEFFQVSKGEFPVFDLILLGMGDDGHTASLFPHTDALSVRDRLVTVGNKDGQPRLTFTVPLLNNSRCVIFMVAGENKQSALAQIFAPSGDETSYPARLIQPMGELWWLLDQSAGVIIS